MKKINIVAFIILCSALVTDTVAVRPNVVITNCDPWVLTYNTGHTSPPEFTRHATASGTPSGGTYAWTVGWGEGWHEIGWVDLTNKNSATVTITGIAWGWVRLTVTYTVNECSDEAFVDIMVRRMITTTPMYSGRLISSAGYNDRNYYHKIRDQRFNSIEVVHIFCHENVVWTGGDWLPGYQSDNQTLWHGGDGQWNGGIALRDWLHALNNKTCSYHQTIWSGYFYTFPEYNIYYDPYNESEEMKVWKVGIP